MGDSDDDNYVTFGVPLDPLDEDNLPRKKPVTIEDQYAYDAQGRRRFHGAFTGGFSAGYYNTVGTPDGWRPQQFKSSRSSKAENVVQRPEDFMDDEDTGQFGIAPKGIRATSDYADHRQKGVKRERACRENDGPIPGVPVLKELLRPVRETVGITLLKQMGWKPGQGVGSRLTKKEKAKVKKQIEKIRSAHYPRKNDIPSSSTDESEDESGDMTFAPDDYEPFRCNPKDNFFGIGYSGLERRTILSGHVNLFDTPVFSMQEKNKKLSIHGKAFGVGAFEADDEDIYAKEDMSHYDFALGPERKVKSRWSDNSSSKDLMNNSIEGFVRAENRLEIKKSFPPPELPKDFTPVHVIRKSRFFPPIESTPRSSQVGQKRDLKASDRARILDDSNKPHNAAAKQPNAIPSVASNIVARTLNLHGRQQIEERQNRVQHVVAPTWMDKLNAQNFVKAKPAGQSTDAPENVEATTECKDSGSSAIAETDGNEANKCDQTAKVFFSDSDKQSRFEQYLAFKENNENHKFPSIQPLSMTEWDREQERTEFEQAARLFASSTPMIGESTCVSDSQKPNVISAQAVQDSDTEIQQAVKMKMFGKLTRERIEWRPTSIVCKRFNIPEPKGGCSAPEMQKRSTKFSIFDSLEWNTPSKFLKATDTTDKEVNDITIAIKTENTTETVISNSAPGDVTKFTDESVEVVSEKLKNFEATYEKVFGKGIYKTVPSNCNIQNSSETPLEVKLDEDGKEQDSNMIDVEQNKHATPNDTSKEKSEEKKDLFKAIFLSSSEESDSEPDEGVDSETLKSVLIGKLPSDVNTQRNTSPPRGIFAKVDLDNLMENPNANKKSCAKSSSQLETNDEPNMELEDTSKEKAVNLNTNVMDSSVSPDMYGPALPARLIKTENPAIAEPPTSESFKPVFRSVVIPKVSNDTKLSGKWVERTKVKKSKKDRKKHKHREHKSSKHKRKSKKDKR